MDFVKALSDTRRALFEEALDLLVEKLAQDEAGLGAEFPYATGPDGAWRTMPAAPSDGFGDDLLGTAIGIHLRGVHHGYAEVETQAERRNLLLSPRSLLAHFPGAEAERGNLDAAPRPDLADRRDLRGRRRAIVVSLVSQGDTLSRDQPQCLQRHP